MRCLFVLLMSFFIASGGVCQAGLLGATNASRSKRAATMYNLTVKPYLPLMQLGLDASYYVDADKAVGIHINIDHFLVGGWVTRGFHYKHFLGNSFFVQTNLDHVVEFFHDDEEQGAGASMIIGNEWQFRQGFSVGADWLGGGIYLTEQGKQGRSVTFPKLRVGLSF